MVGLAGRSDGRNDVDRERLEVEMEVEVEVITRNVGRGVEWTNYNIIEYLSLRYLLLSLPALSGD